MRLHTRLRYAPAEVRVEKRADGATILRSPQPLKPYARAVGDWLLHWYDRAPDRTFIAERKGEGWRRVSYRDALSDARRIGQALLNLGLNADRPVAILSDNSVDHALLALGAMHVGVPVAPISPAYSLMSKDFAKLKYIFELLKPGLVFAAEPEKFAPALAAVGATSTPVAKLLEANPGSNLEVAFSRLTPDTVAKILFTSGSTGMPKGVINTHRMLCANQQMLAQVWPFLEDKPPVHRRLAALEPHLRRQLQLQPDAAQRRHALHRQRQAGARPGRAHGEEPARDLADHVLQRAARLRPADADAGERRRVAPQFLPRPGHGVLRRRRAAAEPLGAAGEARYREKNGALSMISSWGSTETAPSAAAVHYPIERAGVIGLPNPGCELKLVPAAGKLEVRVKGPNVTPGYYRRDDLTKAAFDEEGYYRIGDAMKFADPAAPEKGLVFDGRVAEDFKLSTGTWVHVGAMRVKLIAAGNPLIQDAVITGHDRDEIGALVFLSPAAAKDVRHESQGLFRH